MTSTINGIMGLCVADALGVPVEFLSRKKIQANPVRGMRGFGAHNKPAGTWSDDTSLTLCLADSLIKGLDYDNIMHKFLLWAEAGEYTPQGKTFGIGRTTLGAIFRYKSGVSSIKCGGVRERDNGNGSLMRILPISYYLNTHFTNYFDERAVEIVHNLSSLTHGHPCSQIACCIYVAIAFYLLQNYSIETSVERTLLGALRYYENSSKYSADLRRFARIYQNECKQLSEDDIQSSGYVVDTLEAAIWCLLNTNSYKDCVLKAVNLGGDTDTIAAVAGGLAGIRYGYSSIPTSWLETIINREYIENICKKLDKSLGYTD